MPVRLLLEFNLSADLFKSFLESLSSSLVKTFLNGSRSSVNDVLSFLQSESGLLFNGLNDLEFLSASSFEDYVERSLLLSGSSLTTGNGAGSNCNCSSSGFNTILVLEDLSEFINFLNSKVYQLFSKSFKICHCCINLDC